jgi:histone-lysine N-methyltransferase SETMAR
MVCRHSMALLDSIVIIDESVVSFHMPETRQQLKQWTKKGQPGPIKAKVHATRNKQIVLTFFDNKGLINTSYVPSGKTVNTLSRFLAIFKKKQPNMVAGEWFFHWDNALVYTATIVKDWMAAKDFRPIEHPPPPYSPDLAPEDFFLFLTSWRTTP